MADKVWRTQGGDTDKVWRRADTRRTHGGHKADTGRTKCRDAVARTMRPHGGLIADKLRGRSQSISRPAFLFSKREPHSKLFGENPTVNCLGN